MAHKTELDAVDRKILRLLATDGRSSYQAVADEVGLSRPAVMERVKRLEEAGYITGYGARVDRVKAGFPVTAFVAVRYGSTNYVGDAEKRDHVDGDAGEHERPRIFQQVDRPSGSRSTPARAVSQTFNSGGSSFTR